MERTCTLCSLSAKPNHIHYFWRRHHTRRFQSRFEPPVLKYFDVAKVKNVDDRKRHMTIENLLTMTAGMNTEGCTIPSTPTPRRMMLFTWRPPTIGCNTRLMNPLRKNRERTSYIAAQPPSCWPTFSKETGQDIDTYGEKYLFAPLGIRHYWKRDYVGTVDTEGGLYLNDEDLAKNRVPLFEQRSVGGQTDRIRGLGEAIGCAPFPCHSIWTGEDLLEFNWWLVPLNPANIPGWLPDGAARHCWSFPRKTWSWCSPGGTFRMKPT